MKTVKNISALLITAGLGLILKYYRGIFHNLLNNSLAGIPYVIFWIILAAMCFPKAKPVVLSIWVTLITCLLEFMQLLQTPFLIYLRQFWLGKIILGTTFTWTDFPWYFLGGTAGYFIIKKLNNSTKKI